MPIIQINQAKDLSINQELLELYKTLKGLQWKKVDFDLSTWKWVSPFFTTALVAYIKQTNICICDTGRGIAGSYFQEEGLQLSDTEALQKALAGDSTKSNERGYGIRTSIKVVCEGLGGQFCLLSGNSFVIANSTQQYISHFPDFSWKGTIITYRIPRPQHEVDIYGLIG